jgi:hypothetical protein
MEKTMVELSLKVKLTARELRVLVVLVIAFFF